MSSWAAKELAKRFGGDLSSADWRHFGRLAGFTNRKHERVLPNGLGPFVRLRQCEGEDLQLGALGGARWAAWRTTPRTHCPGIVVRAPTCGDRLRTIRTVIGIATTIIGIASATLRLDGKFTFLRCTVRRRLRDAQQQINARIPSQGA